MSPNNPSPNNPPPNQVSPSTVSPSTVSTGNVLFAVSGVVSPTGRSALPAGGWRWPIPLATLVHGLVVAAVSVTVLVGVQAATTGPAAADLGCGSIPVLSAACDVATDPFEWGYDQVTGVAGELIEGAFDYFAGWMAKSAVAMLGLVSDAIAATTSPNLAGAQSTFAVSMVLARGLALPLLVLCALYSVLKHDTAVAVKSAFLYLPGSVIGMTASLWFLEQLLTMVDTTTTYFEAMTGAGIGGFSQSTAGNIGAGIGVASPGLLAIFSMVLILAGLVLWIVMLIRSAAILVTYAFMPIAFAGLLFPATRGWIKRLIEIQLSFILSKLLIAGIFAIGGSVLTTADNALAGMLQAAALFVLASMSPFVLLKVLPFVSTEMVHAAEGPSKIPTRMATYAATTAAGVALYKGLGGTQLGGNSTAGAGGGGSGGGSTGGSTKPPLPPTSQPPTGQGSAGQGSAGQGSAGQASSATPTSPGSASSPAARPPSTGSGG